MSSSKLPHLGMVATGSLALGLQFLGLVAVAAITAFLLFNHVRKVA